LCRDFEGQIRYAEHQPPVNSGFVFFLSVSRCRDVDLERRLCVCVLGKACVRGPTSPGGKAKGHHDWPSPSSQVYLPLDEFGRNLTRLGEIQLILVNYARFLFFSPVFLRPFPPESAKHGTLYIREIVTRDDSWFPFVTTCDKKGCPRKDKRRPHQRARQPASPKGRGKSTARKPPKTQPRSSGAFTPGGRPASAGQRGRGRRRRRPPPRQVSARRRRQPGWRDVDARAR